MRERKLFSITGISNRAFSVTWPVAIQIHWRKRLHKKEFNSHGTGLGHQHGGSDVIGTGKALILGATQLLFRRGDEHAFGAHNSQQLSKFVGTKQSFYKGLRKKFISYRTPTTLQAVVSPGRTLSYEGRETTASIRLLLWSSCRPALWTNKLNYV